MVSRLALGLLPCATFANAVRAVETGRARACVLPVDNTLAGSIHEVYDLLLTGRLAIAGETRVRISHCLLTGPGVGLKDVKRVYSHPVALAQCAGFFRRHLRLEIVPFYDTAGAARFIVEKGLRDAAAIAGLPAARAWGTRVLARGLEDHRENHTRFLLLKPPGPPPRGADKTSVAFTARNVPGALFKSIGVFALRDINLTKIESRPLKGRPWEYCFYLDFMGSPREERCRNALRHLAEVTESLRVLGSYRSAR